MKIPAIRPISERDISQAEVVEVLEGTAAAIQHYEDLALVILRAQPREGSVDEYVVNLYSYSSDPQIVRQMSHVLASWCDDNVPASGAAN